MKALKRILAILIALVISMYILIPIFTLFEYYTLPEATSATITAIEKHRTVGKRKNRHTTYIYTYVYTVDDEQCTGKTGLLASHLNEGDALSIRYNYPDPELAVASIEVDEAFARIATFIIIFGVAGLVSFLSNNKHKS